MILVTGGAGFIGSNLHAALMQRGHETVILDRLGHGDKWRNFAKHPPSRLISPDDMAAFLETRPPVEVVFHLGAISSTTATDGDLVWGTNVERSRDLWHWCAHHGVRMVYASSAATYGNGAAGFEDDGSVAALEKLRPLNLYGWTKNAFDLRVARAIAGRRPHPPQWVGLKFFNVYGPNEYHKGHMISVVKVKYDEVSSGSPARLFRSSAPGIADGEQKRDFIWIGDVVDTLLWVLDNPHVNGLFNLGTGQARSYLDLANAMCDAVGLPRKIEFIDMPAALQGQYQSFTQASMGRLRAAGYGGPFTPLEEGVRRYVHDYLTQPDTYVWIPVLLFPQFDPVLVQIGPFAIRWYALAYILGLVLGWRLLRRLVRLPPIVATVEQADDFLTWATLGVVLGGRIGFVLFYQPAYFSHPSMIFAVWEGGMSFHGGAIGVAIAILWFCRRNGIPLLGLADRIAVCAPIGLGLGRIANFINGELWGREAPETLPWAMIFPSDPLHLPRHPSQIYEALLEGLTLFVVMFLLSRREAIRARFGFLTGAFLVGYGLARITGEFFREPDVYVGYLAGGATMGQLLSIPMVIAGLWLILRTR